MRFPASLFSVLMVATLLECGGSRAQEPASLSDAEIQKEARTAQSLFDGQNFVGALPLYEDLHKRQPNSSVWDERLAACILSVGGAEAEAGARRERARQLLLEAKAAGDNSNFLQVMLEKLSTPTATAPATVSPGMEALKRAEKAFTSGDLPGALKGYEEAVAADPKLYQAPLFAGDTEYKLGHYVEANQWYARAVAVDKDRETAYRYWGDCLMKLGDSTQAEGKYIDAIVAEPYARTPKVGLKQWAEATKAQLAPPPVTLPARATVGAKGQTNISIDPSGGSAAISAAMMYSMNFALWMNEKFKKTYPAEKEYRHSLAEEMDGLKGALTVLQEQKISPDKMDATWRALFAIQKDGMLECWILLDHPDQGIAQDYVAYRAEHRDLLHAYIAKYDVHPK